MQARRLLVVDVVAGLEVWVDGHSLLPGLG